jgi:elongation factor Ts
VANYVASYVHNDGQIGVLVELECEDPASLRTADFKALAHDLALQVAAMKPFCVEPKGLDPELWQQALSELQPELAGVKAGERQKRINTARERLENERCLVKQAFIKDPERKVEDRMLEVAEKLKERIRVKRFSRFDAEEI